MNASKILESLNDRCKYIFSIIQKDGPITKNELINKADMKLSTLNRDFQLLLDSKIIVEAATAKSTGGRKPALFDVNPYGFYSIGIDISRTYTQIIVTNLKIEIVADKTISHFYNIDNIIQIIPKRIKDLFNTLKIDKSMLLGIGIGIVGGFEVKALQDKLIKGFEVPVHIDNGENTAVLGEYFYGLGKDKQNIAYINCGVGIRTGVISSGVLMRTINNNEDAIGHMIVQTGGELCSCGNHGCIESYASILKITENFISESEKGKNIFSNKDIKEIDYTDVCSLAEDNNEDAINVLMYAALNFGIGLSNFIRLFNPQLIILSGPLIKQSKLFFDECKKIALENCHINNNDIKFSRGGYFKNKSICVGASVMVIKELLSSK